ncbi:MAG: hypothetical protein ACEQR8_07605 [Cypionkella sp.]
MTPAKLIPALLATAGGACSALEGPDWLVAEARSPDGQLVARLWCEDFCDVPEAATLTVSPSGRPVEVERTEFGTVEGEMPDGDALLRIFRREAERAPTLEWTTATTLVVAGRCLNDGDYRPLGGIEANGVKVRIADEAPPGACGRSRD